MALNENGPIAQESGAPEPVIEIPAPLLSTPVTTPSVPKGIVVGTLQDALTDTALHLAWERVLNNGGAAGMDHETIAAFGKHLPERLAQLLTEIKSSDYTPQPLRLVQIPKRNGSQRTLAIPAVRDRVLQTAVAQLLGPGLDAGFGQDSYGYRPKHSVAQAIARVQTYRNAGLVHVVDADIKSFFDYIDHTRLLQVLRTRIADDGVCQLIELWLAAVLRDGNRDRLQVRGLAQGSPLSPLLANLYLDDFDHAIENSGLAMVRYADDFVVLCADACAAAQALEKVRCILEDYKLKLNESKTRLTSFARGFEFLGVRFRLNHVEVVHPGATPWLLPHQTDQRPDTTSAILPQQEPLPHSSKPSEQPIGLTLQSLDPALDEAVLAATGEATNAGIEAGVHVKTEPASPLLQSLYVGEHGCWLTKEHDRVVVSKAHEVKASVPLGQIDQIAIMGNAMVSTALLRHCAQRRVRIAIGGFGGELLTLDRGALADERLLEAQFQAQHDPQLQLLLATCFVDGKLHNSRTVLRRFSRREGGESVQKHLQMIERMQKRLVNAPDLNSVRGLEGQGARHYFEALRTVLPMGIDFPGRQRRPPRDPVNVTLSLGYTVLANNLHTLVRLEGLNAHMGHLHATVPGSMALVSDLMEEFRAPVVDSVALGLWRQGKLHDSDFEWSTAPDELPCRLRSSGRRTFIDALEAKFESKVLLPGAQWAIDLRRIMQMQVRHYLRVLLRRDEIYHPFKIR